MTRIDVPAREGRGVRVAAGQRFRVIDVEGGQVADTFAFRADDISEYHSAEHTRAYVSRLFPRPPMPTSVSSRVLPSNSSTSDNSRSRPMNDVTCCGRLLGVDSSERRAGNCCRHRG